MNWSDYVVLAIIVGFGIIGLINGFIFSIFKIASFFTSIYLAIRFHPVVAEALSKTALHDSIKASILKNLTARVQAEAPKADAEAKKAAADSVVNHLSLPGFLKENILDKIPEPSKLIDLSSILNTVSEELTRMIISVLSLILLYVLIRVGLMLVRFILKGIAKLPVFKQMDRIGGFAFGAVEGLLTVYILCAILVLFNSAPQFKPVFDAMDGSLVAGFFYQNNFIVDWMFPGKTAG